MIQRRRLEAAAMGERIGLTGNGNYRGCDARGRPLDLVLAPGQAHDIQGFGPLFRMIAGKIEALLANNKGLRR